ncbi:hypothetical protein MTBBW1_710007 [Desulfamplus magnetovallimortis]|uniref:Uncharacterized protein n=1 Tax=Desulfamplus magnetovallimortis TaxID=1246637 RepID=A0A1W1HIR2_9BACT|nr:circularly permuted type 2 ATP-grasp protein [Desulfamplus magnetovallimortis]SLM32407.1 hypothetical protein MTBBW1_710007 [Desulfamplus magnetovallimortis]
MEEESTGVKHVFPENPAITNLCSDLFTPDGKAAPHWQVLITYLNSLGSQELERRWQKARQIMHEHGAVYNIFSEKQEHARPWELDPVPFPLPAETWEFLEKGIKQRTRLLTSIYADIYGPQKLIRNSHLPPELFFANPRFLRQCQGLYSGETPQLHFHATDLCRFPDGRWRILSDQTQSPSGAGYALENRIILSRILPRMFHSGKVMRLAPFFKLFTHAFMEISGMEKREPNIVMLSSGPSSPTYFEHVFLSRYLGFTLVESSDLTVRNDSVYLKTLGGLHPVDVILRRIEDSFCDPLVFGNSSLMGISGLVQAVRSGNVAVSNPLGSGILETPGLIPFLPGLCRLILGEELLIEDLPTSWCGQPEPLNRVLTRINDSNNPVIIASAFAMPHIPAVNTKNLATEKLNSLALKIKAAPYAYVSREPMKPCSLPVWDKGALTFSHATIRMFSTAITTPGSGTALESSPSAPFTSQPSSPPESSMQQASLPQSNMQQSSLPQSSMQQPSLQQSNMQQASLPQSNMQQASLPQSSMQQPSLQQSSMQQASLHQSNMQQPSLSASKVHISLSPDKKIAVMPGALTKISSDPDTFLLNAGKEQGSKDTWCFSNDTVEYKSMMHHFTENLEIHRGSDLPSRVADNMLWLGRYVERTEGMLRVIRSVLSRLNSESRLDIIEEFPFLLRIMANLEIISSGLSGSDAGYNMKIIETEILDSMFSTQRAGSIKTSLQNVQRVAASVRDRLSNDSWHILGRMENDLTQFSPHRHNQISEAQELVNEMILTISAFAGLALESMTRGMGWRFMDMGRRLERAGHMITLLQSLFSSRGIPKNQEFEALLEVADSTITYHNRYRTTFQMEPIVDLLLLDELNPRAVGFQMASLFDHVETLPRSTPRPFRSTEEKITLNLTTRLRLTDIKELMSMTQEGNIPGLTEMLEFMKKGIQELGNQITQHYLSRIETEKQLRNSFAVSRSATSFILDTSGKTDHEV